MLFHNVSLIVDLFETAHNVLHNSELQPQRDPNNIANIKNVRKLHFWVHAHFFDNYIHQVKVER